MIETQSITDFGQIHRDDVLVIETKTGIKIIAIAKKVIRPGTKYEEVVTNLRQNHYFIVQMMLDGKSWAKSVVRIPGARMTASTNTTMTLKDYEDAL